MQAFHLFYQNGSSFTGQEAGIFTRVATNQSFYEKKKKK